MRTIKSAASILFAVLFLWFFAGAIVFSARHPFVSRDVLLKVYFAEAMKFDRISYDQYEADMRLIYSNDY